MRRAAVALAVLGLGGVAAGVLMLAPVDPQPAASLAAPGPDAVTPAVIPPAVVRAAQVRAVAPETVAQPQVASDQLVRVEPRAPLSTFSAPTRKRKNHGRVFRPLIQSAGQFSGSGVAIELAGVLPTVADRMCVDGAGIEWPCGMRARAAFRAFVRGRALLCDLPEEITEKSYRVACTLGKQDVGSWLVAQGWAQAEADGPYVAAGNAARAAGKGIFGQAPVVEPLPEPQPYVSALPEPAAPPVVD